MAPKALPYKANIRTRTRVDGTTVWDVRFRLGGSYKSRSFGTHASARRWRDYLQRFGPVAALQALDDANEPATDTGALTFAQLGERYMKSRTGLKQGTMDHYRAFLDKSLYPALGHLPIERITREHIAAWVNAMSVAEGLSAKTIKNRHNFASSVLTYAQEEGLIARNPARGMRLPRSERAEMTFLTPAEFRVLLRYIPERHRALVVLLAGTGLRWGEATALRWRDLNFDSKPPTLSVVRSWSYSRTAGWEVGPPKTRASERTVFLPEQVVSMLQPLRGGADELVFTSHNGGQLQQSVFYNTVWRPARRMAAGLDAHTTATAAKVRRYPEFNQPPAEDDRILKTPRVHDLRHTHVSWLIAAGTPLAVIKDRLGHQSITTTVDRYGHLAAETRQAGVDAAELALGAAGLDS